MTTNISLRLPEQNNVTLVGRLTHDPEVRFTAKGNAVCRFSIAVNRRYKDSASGNWMDNVSFVPIVVWGEIANRCGEKLKKGLPVHVEGRLQSRQWESKEGQKRTVLEVMARRVQFLSRVTEGAEADASAEPATEAEPQVSEEEIPF